MEELGKAVFSDQSFALAPPENGGGLIVARALRLIAGLPAWKLTNVANRIRFELKHHNGG